MSAIQSRSVVMLLTIVAASFLCAASPASAAYIDAVLAHPDLLATWRLGEATGPTAGELVGGGANDGTYTNVAPGDFSQPGLIVGDADTAVRFNGTNSLVDAGNDASLNGAFGGLTVAAWIQPASVSGNMLIAGKWANVVANDHFGFFMNNGTLIAAVADGSTVINSAATGTAVLQAGLPYFVAFTWTAGTGAQKLYVDGAVDPISNVPQMIGTINTGSATNFHIGAQTTSFRQFDGLIDEVALFDDALTDQEILDLYLAGITPPQIIPEPSTLALLVLGVFGLVVRRRRQGSDGRV